jgi:hypothetical protein
LTLVNDFERHDTKSTFNKSKNRQAKNVLHRKDNIQRSDKATHGMEENMWKPNT